MYFVVRCTIAVVNTSDKSHDGTHNVAYLPFSVSTLKLRVTNEEQKKMTITITPKNSRKDNEYCCGFVDSDTRNESGILLSWGGGDEEGCVLSLDVGQTRYAYIFIDHKSEFQASYDLTLKVRIKMDLFALNKDTPQPDIVIKLHPLQTGSKIVHQEPIDKKTIVYEGTLVGLYYPRWFPESNKLVSDGYYNHSEIPKFKIHLNINKSGHHKDSVQVTLDDRKDIALIVGDMRGATFCTDLFKLDENNFIIRLWFFWLNYNQFKDQINLEISGMRVQRGPFTISPELPDSERYDIIVSRNGAVLGVGTDYHWKEYWYKIADGQYVMQGYIADWWKHKLHKLLENWVLGMHSVDYQSILSALKEISSKTANRQDIDPRTTVVAEDALIDRRVDLLAHEKPERGKSIFRSHVPYVENGIIKHDMISEKVDEKFSF